MLLLEEEEEVFLWEKTFPESCHCLKHESPYHVYGHDPHELSELSPIPVSLVGVVSDNQLCTNGHKF